MHMACMSGAQPACSHRRSWLAPAQRALQQPHRAVQPWRRQQHAQAPAAGGSGGSSGSPSGVLPPHIKPYPAPWTLHGHGYAFLLRPEGLSLGTTGALMLLRCAPPPGLGGT